MAHKTIQSSLLALLVLLAIQGWSETTGTTDNPIPRKLLLAYLAGQPVFTLFDARSGEEYAAGHIHGAINMPHDGDLLGSAGLPEDRNTAIVVYCKTGKRAGILQQRLRSLGYNDVRVLGPGQITWMGESLPVFNCGPSADRRRPSTNPTHALTDTGEES